MGEKASKKGYLPHEPETWGITISEVNNQRLSKNSRALKASSF